MENYYHFTSFNNIVSISDYGLQPQRGIRSISAGDSRNTICLSKGMKQAITMYSSMLWHFENREKILNPIINSYENIIARLERSVKFGGGSVEENERINIIKNETEIMKQIVNCNQFADYLGGPGCFLSVHGIDNYLYENQEECWHDEPIEPNNINIVTLKNKESDMYINFREVVMAYFMSNYMPNEIPQNNAMHDINELYRENSNMINTYNKLHYDLYEIPIKEYVHPIVKIKH